MTDQDTGCIGVWNVQWGFSRVDFEEVGSIIVMLVKLENLPVWIASS